VILIDGPGWRRLKSLVNIGAKVEKSSEAGKKTLRCTNVEQKNSNDLESEQQTRKKEKKKEREIERLIAIEMYTYSAFINTLLYDLFKIFTLYRACQRFR
jgi:hypothetical protein